MEKGKLIVIEGACDGIGKTTQYERLSKFFLENGQQIVKHHFPSYETYQGAPVERYLKGEFGNPNELSPYFINSLYAIDRAITWKTILEKEYEQEKIILLDRYTTSSLIYQSALIENLEERIKFIDYITDFEYQKLGIKKPDMVIFLEASFDLITEIRKSRQENAGIINDIHETNLEFMKKVYENAIFLAKYLNWEIIKCDDKDKLREIDDIHEKILKRVQKIIN